MQIFLSLKIHANIYEIRKEKLGALLIIDIYAEFLAMQKISLFIKAADYIYSNETRRLLLLLLCILKLLIATTVEYITCII